MMLYRRSDAGMLRSAWELSAGMLSLVIAIGLGWWFGRTLDGWTGTAPWLTALFTVFGLAAGVLNVYRAIGQALLTARGDDPDTTRKPPLDGRPDTNG
jgi:ATP synthase protein I